jgi:thiamine biosynthesis lipoprotein
MPILEKKQMNVMATQTWRLWGIFIVNIAGLAASASAQSLERFSFAEPHLGTIIELTLYAPDENAANDAARAAFARVKELDRIFSDYKPDSEAMRLCEKAGSGTSVKVSPELFSVLRQALSVSERTGGAFDVTVGPLVQLWRRARKLKTLPTPDEIADAKKMVSWQLVVLNETAGTVELKQAGMRLDFGGIAKGYIAQEICRLLRERGLNRSLVAVAGDIVAGDPPPNATGWKVGVAPLDRPNGSPSRLLLLKNRAISTSGDAFQFVEISGVRFSHIVDPATGLGLTSRSSCTVIAPEGTAADALATAVCVLGVERGLKLIEETDEVEALIVQSTDNGLQVLESNQFHNCEIKSPPQ